MSATISRNSGNIDRACSSEKLEVVAGTNLTFFGGSIFKGSKFGIQRRVGTPRDCDNNQKPEVRIAHLRNSYCAPVKLAALITSLFGL